MQKIMQILNRLLQILRLKPTQAVKPASAPECQELLQKPKATPPARKPRSKAGTVEKSKEKKVATKPGLYANIHAKRERIKAGSGEKMRKPGTAGAPTAKAFKKSAKTAKPAKAAAKKGK
jgi:hypothetical protein